MMRTKQLTIFLLAFLLLIGMNGCGSKSSGDTAAPSTTDKNTVLIENYSFQPAEITIKSGESVTWINKDSVKHTATGDSFDSGLLGKDESYTQTFDTAGTYDYHCTPHPYMKAKVIVE